MMKSIQTRKESVVTHPTEPSSDQVGAQPDPLKKAWNEGYEAGHQRGTSEKECREALDEAYREGFDEGYRDGLAG